MTSLAEILKRCEGTAEFLDEAITDVNQKGISGDTPLHIVAGWGDLAAVNVLLSAGAHVDVLGDLGRTALFAAISNEHIDVAFRLLEAGASATVVDELGVTPELLALKSSNEMLANAICTKRNAPDSN